VWREAWANLTHAWQEKHISLKEEIADIDLTCVMDRLAMEQVFRNILENAVAASPTHGAIVIACRNGFFEGLPVLRTAIRDQGPGLSAEQRRRIFEPFFTTKTKGTGLGMAIAQRLMQSHGGSIAVAEDCQAGAEIVVSLPRGSL
jgi:signal transduction histidine kinase